MQKTAQTELFSTQVVNNGSRSTEKEPMTMEVSDNLIVTIIPNDSHEFVMTSHEVAKGYGVSLQAIQMHASRNPDEILEGTHFVRGKQIVGTLNKNIQNQVFWTKTGVIRLGFFVKSERGIQFRDWAEKVILKAITAPKIQLAPVVKKKHNRLNPARLLDIMYYVGKIPDIVVEGQNLRDIIADKIMGKEVSHD